MTETALQWFINGLLESNYITKDSSVMNDFINKAKEMEKEQIKELIELPSDEEMRKELFYQKQVMNPYPTIEYAYTAYEKGFMDCAKLIIDRTLNK